MKLNLFFTVSLLAYGITAMNLEKCAQGCADDRAVVDAIKARTQSRLWDETASSTIQGFDVPRTMH